MARENRAAIDCSQPVKLVDDVYWVGYKDVESGLHCNPYLIVDGDEAVLIDGGSRPDFSTVMMKIMATGIHPHSITHLIYQHYDPDLCGSIPNLEDIIARPDLKIVSHQENNIFIKHYAVQSSLYCMEAMGFKLTLKSGRTIRFARTPYAHSAGSFVSLDEKTGILFTSDIFGSYGCGDDWGLFADVPENCFSCEKNPDDLTGNFSCGKINDLCSMSGVFDFHRRVMTSGKALKNALKAIGEMNPSMIAPQHGSVIAKRRDYESFHKALVKLEKIGIDGIIGE